MPSPRSASISRVDQTKKVVDKALQALLAIAVAGVVYRYCYIDASDPFKCNALLNRGEWLDPGPKWSSRNPFQNWQPPGCMMYEYKQKEVAECFKNRRIVFIGDSTTRQIFWAVAKKMDQEGAEEKIAEMMELEQKHKDFEFMSAGVTVQFFWDPWLNSTKLERELRLFKPDIAMDSKSESASLLLLGAPGLWYARHGEENFFKAFKDAIDGIIPYMDHLPPTNSASPFTIYSPPPSRSPNLLLMAPVQVPRYQSLSPSREATITPEKIDQMNDYLQQTSAYSGADITWSYSLMTWSGRGEYEESGLHVVDNVAHRKADVLLSLRCNNDAALRGFPFDRTCCSKYTKPGGLQWLLIVSGILLLPVTMFLRRKRSAQIGRFLPSNEKLGALTIFGLVICFCFYADRTQIFEKSHKQFRLKEFLLACSVAGAIGLFSTRRVDRGLSGKASTSIGFLCREQTDEWKGWMQAFILIYHFTGSSKTLWIYEIVRVLVASYLFITGYGHTLYFLRKSDFSLRRAAAVLVRLNLLSCTLPYLMRTDYLQYYFAPLVSFWFLVIYFTMKISHEKNFSLSFLGLKMLIAATITTCMIAVPGILETVGFLLKNTCSISWNMKEWRFRILLDMHIVYLGMVVAAVYHRVSRLGVLGKYPALVDEIIVFVQEFRRTFQWLMVVFSILLLLAFRGLTSRSPNKEDYNWWQPYISFIPILSFVALRNCHRLLRSYYSTGFARLGRCSLETYVLQYHTWLAGDTKGLLRIGLWNHWVESAMLTCIFLWVSSTTAEATQVLTSWIVDGPCTLDKVHDHSDDRLSPQILPKTQRAPLKDIDPDGNQGGVIGLPKRMRVISEDLRWRLGAILVMLWVCNVTYR